MGFKAISSDKYIFIRIIGIELTIITLYMNNILILIKLKLLINIIKGGIKAIFKVKNISELKRILNIQVYRKNNSIIID